MASRDETLENFQAFTGLEDISTCMSILEQHGWNLLNAVNSVMPQDFSSNSHNSGNGSLERQPQNDTVIDLTTDDTTDKPHPLITNRNSHRYIYIYIL